MISVIIPVYNVEPYLRKCLDSVVNQTYRNLEILVIDDGSTDGSGAICDEYASDRRMRIFHTENRGLSCARNLGLDEAKGEWIGFVDSDDWIEPDMYEALLKRAEETGADIVECGVFREYPGRTVERKKKERKVSGERAVQELLVRELSNAVWNKLWKRRCFETIRFPEERIFEEYSVTYQVFAASDTVSTTGTSKYHYLQRKDSLSRIHDMNNLIGYWRSNKERYEFLEKHDKKSSMKEQLRYCATAVARTWAYYYDCSLDERNTYNDTVLEMNAFTKQHIPLFGERDWRLSLRVGVWFPHYNNKLSFRMSWLINRVFKKINACADH